MRGGLYRPPANTSMLVHNLKHGGFHYASLGMLRGAEAYDHQQCVTDAGYARRGRSKGRASKAGGKAGGKAMGKVLGKAGGNALGKALGKTGGKGHHRRSWRRVVEDRRTAPSSSPGPAGATPPAERRSALAPTQPKAQGTAAGPPSGVAPARPAPSRGLFSLFTSKTSDVVAAWGSVWSSKRPAAAPPPRAAATEGPGAQPFDLMMGR